MLAPSLSVASVTVVLIFSVANAAIDILDATDAAQIATCDVAKLDCEASLGGATLLQTQSGEAAAVRAAKAPVPMPSATGVRPLPPILYVKTHKTGSTTVQRIVQGMAERRNLSIMLPVDNHKLGYPYAFPGTHDALRHGPPAHQFDVICNHAILNASLMYAYLKPRPHFITIVRDPDEQMISAYNYYFPNATWDEYLKVAEDSFPDVAKFRYKNCQAHDLGWYAFVGGYTIEFDNNRTKISEWLAMLDTHLDSILILEHLDEGLALFRQKIKVDLREMRSAKINTAVTAKVYPSEGERHRLRALGNVDRALYAHLRRRFWQEWSSGNVPQLEADVVALKQMNEALQRSCDEGDLERCPPSLLAPDLEVTACLKKSSKDHACAS